MKITYRIPTEMYAFVEIEEEGEKSAEEIRIEYDALKKAFDPTPVNALPDKEFNRVVDEYIATGSIKNGVEFYEKMSTLQQDIIQAIKRSLKRINR